MNDGADAGLVDAEAESDGTDHDANFVGHPALLILAALVGIHFAVITDGGDAAFSEKIDGLFYFGDGGRVDDDTAALIVAEGVHELNGLILGVGLFHHVAEIRTVKAHDVFVGVAEF